MKWQYHAIVLLLGFSFLPFPAYAETVHYDGLTLYDGTSNFGYNSNTTATKEVNGHTIGAFLYHPASDQTIDRITFVGLPSTTTVDTYVSWEVQEISSTSTDSTTIIGKTFPVAMKIYQDDTVFPTPYGHSPYENELPFLQPVTLEFGKNYRFVLLISTANTYTDPISVTFYAWDGTAETYNHTQGCAWSDALAGLKDPFEKVCADVWNTGTSPRLGMPMVKLSYSGQPFDTTDYFYTSGECSTNSKEAGQGSCRKVVDYDTISTIDYSAKLYTETDNLVFTVKVENQNGVLLQDIIRYIPTATSGYEVDWSFEPPQGTSTDYVYYIYSCLESVEYDWFQVQQCTTQIIGWGTSTQAYIDSLTDVTASSTLTAWQEAGCDDIGLTDVFKGAKCALIWAFIPSQASTDKFTQSKNMLLSVYPIGYATHMLSDINDALFATSTVMDREVNIYRFFGKEGESITVSWGSMTQYVNMIDPLFALLDNILWFIFAIWFLRWAYSRNMKE